MAIKARYKGDGEFYEGVPARNLSDEEYDALTTEQKHDVRHGGLYAMVEDKPKADSPAAAPAPPTEAGGKDGA